MPQVHLRRARVDKEIFAESTHGETDLVLPGEYLVEEAGCSVRLHAGAGAGAERPVTEVSVPAFDTWLTRHELVFLSWS